MAVRPLPAAMLAGLMVVPLVAAACMTLPASAEELPPLPASDPRVLLLDYAQGGMFHIDTAPDTVQTVLLAQGDQIRSVIVSDPQAYAITVAGSGDALAIRPNGAGALAMVTVRTDQRSYDLELVAGGNQGPVPAVLRFTYGERRKEQASLASLPPATAIQQVAGAQWKLSGSKALRPSDIADDGDKTYIAWGKGQAMPAVFALEPGGREQMVDGYMRAGLFTIDRVHEELVFRVDGEEAHARRVVRKARHERS